jgi:hypothetical protein
MPRRVYVGERLAVLLVPLSPLTYYFDLSIAGCNVRAVPRHPDSKEAHGLVFAELLSTDKPFPVSFNLIRSEVVSGCGPEI